MSIRNNEDRFGARNSGTAEVPQSIKEQLASAMDFVTPTEYVDLPSKGKGYPPDHPLYEKEMIEIRFMTAKDEDVLTSRSLLKKGVALDRLIGNLVVDKSIPVHTLLIGDRNAIVIKARSSAYGNIYETEVACPSCMEKSKYTFDLLQPSIYHGDNHEDYEIEPMENGNHLITLPHTKFKIEVKLLSGVDETALLKRMQKKRKSEDESLITDQMRLFIVSVNGDADHATINYLINNMIAQESRYLRKAYAAVSPDVKISADFECPSCGHEQELEVPFGADFFWPDR